MTEANDPTQRGSEGPAPQSEEELRAQIEEQLRTVRVQDVLLESVVSVLNLAARRIAKEDERDLEQARIGIEAVRAVVDMLDPEPARQVRAGLSQVQVLYAQQAGEEGSPGGGEGKAENAQEAAGRAEPPRRQAQAPRQGGAQRRPSKLWTPPGT
jgi:hypothetical protein